MGESAEIANFAANCGLNGWSSEFKLLTINNKTVYACVSNRPNGCAATLPK